MASIIVVGHTVKDFATWKLAFDHRQARRRELGFISHSLFRDVSRHGRIIVTLRTDSAHHAQSLSADRAVLEEALVLSDESDVEIWFGEGIEDRGYHEEVLAVQ